MSKIQSLGFKFLSHFGLNKRENEKNYPMYIATVFLIAIAAVIIRFVFWKYTGRVWEDALITVRHSENFASGLGLTHSQPQLHGFTSPISVLIPLAGDLLNVGFGITLLKLVSALASFFGILYMAAILRNININLPKFLTLIPLAYIAFEHHQILWGMAGMETQLVTVILLMSMYYLIAWKPIPLGISLALCLLARPDFAIWLVVIGIYILFKFRKDLFKLRIPREILKIALSVVAIYTPWLIATTLYYGSPIPHTIIAKSSGYNIWWQMGEWNLSSVFEKVWLLFTDFIFLPLGPSFAGHGSGFGKLYDNGFISHLMIFFILSGTLAIILKKVTAAYPILGFVWGFAFYYIFLTPAIFGWYVVPFSAASIIIATYGIYSFGDFLLKEVHVQKIFLLISILYIGSMVFILPSTFKGERGIQLYIEDKVRKEIGLYLRENLKTGETIGSESLGYVGYYSQGKVYDWPGLCSDEVTEFSKSRPREQRSLYTMLENFKPTYIVLREHEYNAFKLFGGENPWISNQYEVINTYKSDPIHTKEIFLIERNIDLSFVLLKKIQE